MPRIMEVILYEDGKQTRVYNGPEELRIIPKLNPFKFSPEGKEIEATLKPKYKKLHQQFVTWLKNHKSYYLAEGTTMKDLKQFPNITIEKIFALYQMILYFIERPGDWERRVVEYSMYIGESFGEIPDENGNIIFKKDAFVDVIELVMSNKEIPMHYKNKIVDILANEVDKLGIKESYEELKQAYEKWSSTLPDEFSFLEIDKQRISFKSVAIHPEPLINEFTEEVYLRYRSKKEMITELIDNTFSIFSNLELEKMKLENPLSTAMKISANKAHLQIASTTQKFEEYEISYVDTIIQCLNVIEEFVSAHKDALKTTNIVADVPEKFALKREIENFFSFMLTEDPRKHKVILNEKDYEKLIEYVFQYFDNDLKVPVIVAPIKTINTSKGNIIWAFKDIFSELRPEKYYPTSLIELIKACFYLFKDASDSNMQKFPRPQHFDDLKKQV